MYMTPYLFNLYSEYIKENAGLDEAQTGIKIAGRNINNLRYADDTTLHFMTDRWGNSGNSVRLYFLGIHNHCGW